MPDTKPAATAAERINALSELRPLVGKLGAFASHAVTTAIAGLEAELREDALELGRLVSLASTQTVRDLVKKELEAIERELSGASLQPGVAPSAPPLQPAAPKPSSPPAPATARKATTPKQNAPSGGASAKKRGPPMDSPPGGFDPRSWPESTAPALGSGFFHATHAPMRQIPRCPEGSKAARTLLEQRKPVILTHSSLVTPAVGKWDVAYLTEGLAKLPCTVYASNSRHFRYWDDEKNEAGYTLESHARMQKLSMAAGEFRTKLAEGVEGATADGAAAQRYYLQTVLVDGVGDAMTADFRQFGWEGLLETQRRLGWGELSSNLLLVGQKGNVTPAHYDEQQNLFAQLHGTKRVVMFPPEDFGGLYPFPVHHPCDRQSQVDLYAADTRRFPKFGQTQPLEARLEPGDILYIPQYWWHHIENLSDECVSLNFWFKDQAKPQKVVLPLSPAQHLAMRRNIERLVAARLGAREAQAALPQLGLPNRPAHLQTLHDEVAALLGNVMHADDVQPWLAELCDGRFALEHGLV